MQKRYEMVKETEMEREMRGDEDIWRKMETQTSTMSPASLGDADRIRCAFDFQIMFRGFFFLFGAPLLMAEGASVLR